MLRILVVTGVVMWAFEMLEDIDVRKFEGLKEVPKDLMNTKLSDVKGVDEAKAELENIVHYLRNPSVSVASPSTCVQVF